MKRFRLARRCRLAVARPCLAAFLAGWPSVLAAGIAAAGIVAASAPVASAPAARAPVAGATLTAVLAPQASVLNPGPPTGLTANAGNGQVTLSWTPPASDGGAAILGYDVYMGTSSHGESTTPVNTSLIGGTSFTVTGLTNGTTYYFTADAVNDAELRSVTSNEASATPAPPATAPGAPTGLTASAGNAQVSLSWKAPASDGGAQITGYNIYQGTSSSSVGGKPVASAKGTSVTVTSLANGTTYFFKVTAVNKVGEGPASGTVSATPAAPVTNPGAPTRLTATPGNGRVTLSWAAPASDGGAAITGYEIFQGTRPGGESSAPVSSATGTSVTITGLTNGATYYFTVAAVNRAKRQGSHSGEASATPAAGAAPATAASSPPGSRPASAPASASLGGGRATGTPGAPTGLTATAGNARVTLSWTAPAAGAGSAPARYDVYDSTSPGFSPGTPVSSTTGTTATVKGLTNGITYYFVVTAVDSGGQVIGSSAEASAEPTGHAVLTAKTVPTPAIISLAAVAVVATAAALALALRRLRKRPRRRKPLTPPSDVRAVPEPGHPGPVSIHEIHEIGVDETYTVRLEPLPSEIITTLEEVGS